MIDISKVEEEARKELDDEIFREKVEEAKEKIRNKKPLLHILFPWKIKLERR